MWKGVDYQQTTPGAYDELFCRACNAKMTVRRSVMVQTGPYHPKSLNDVFSCPHSGTATHDKQVLRVRKQISEAIE
jgi:hypothetical protein